MSRVAVLVISCDKYSSLWDLFFDRWNKYWPSCPYPVYLVTNAKQYERQGVTNIKTGVDRDWSSNLLLALNRVEEENVLLMLDDAPLDEKVDDHLVISLRERYVELGMNYLNLKALPPPNGIKDEWAGELLPGVLYRAALVPCVWRKAILQSLLIAGESAWEFEIRGSKRADVFGCFYSVRRPALKLLHCVVKGQLDRRAARALRRSGEINTVNFVPMSGREYLALRAREIRSAVFHMFVPSRYRRALRTYWYERILGTDRVI